MYVRQRPQTVLYGAMQELVTVVARRRVVILAVATVLLAAAVRAVLAAVIVARLKVAVAATTIILAVIVAAPPAVAAPVASVVAVVVMAHVIIQPIRIVNPARLPHVALARYHQPALCHPTNVHVYLVIIHDHSLAIITMTIVLISPVIIINRLLWWRRCWYMSVLSRGIVLPWWYRCYHYRMR